MRTQSKTLLLSVVLLLFLFLALLFDQASLAYADQTASSLGHDIDEALDGALVEIAPVNSTRTVNIQNDGTFPGDDVQLYYFGTSSKTLLTWDSDDAGYVITNQRKYDEGPDSLIGRVWDVEHQSKDSGAILHIQNRHTGSDKNAHSQNWRFEQNEDGSYYIKNLRSNRYIGIRDGDKDGSNLMQVSDSKAQKFTITVLSGSEKAFSYSTNYEALSWMKNLPDTQPLSHVSIPGTHDSGTVNAEDAVDLNISAARTQKYYIDQQLAVGVRFFDIRCGEDSATAGDPSIYHTVVCYDNDDQELRLSKVMQYYDEFLTQNPSETVIVLISRVSGGSDKVITQAMERHIKANPDRFWDGDVVPSVGEARGKIVIMRRFDLYDHTLDTSKFGLDLTKWDENDYKDAKKAPPVDKDASPVTWVQDHWNCTGKIKIKYVEDTLDQARTIDENAYLINYVSCSLRNPFSAAQYMFDELDDNVHIANTQPEFLGILPMDFIDARWAKTIYQKNFPSSIPRIILPHSASLTYGQSLEAAQFVGGSASVDGFFEFVEYNAYPTVADSNTTEYTLRFVECPPEGGMRFWSYGKMSVEVKKRAITITPNSTGMEYGTTAEDPEFSDPTKIPFQVTKSSILREDRLGFGLHFYAIDSNSQAISASAPAGEYALAASYTQGGKHENYDITLGDIDQVRYTISPRPVQLTWEGMQVLKTGDTVGLNVEAKIINYAGLDDSSNCSVATIKHYRDNGSGAPGEEITAAAYQEPGRYWAVASTLTGPGAQNYCIDSSTASTNTQKSYWVRDSTITDPVFPETAYLEYGQNITEAEFVDGSGNGTFSLIKADESDLTVLDVPHAATYEKEYLVKFDPDTIPSDIKPASIKVVVDKKAIKARALPATSEYGNELPKFDFLINPQQLVSVHGDTKESLGLLLKAVDSSGKNLSDYNYLDSSGAAYNNAVVDEYDIIRDESGATNTDYAITLIPGTLEITPRMVTFDWSGFDNLVYSGAETNVTANITNLIPTHDLTGFDECALIVSGGRCINAGDYRALVSGLEGNDAANYELPKGIALYKDFSISKAIPQTHFPRLANLIQGQSLDSAILDGTESSTIPGAFAFVRSAYMPEAGTQSFLMIFKPTDTVNYQIVFSMVEVITQDSPAPPPPDPPTPPTPDDPQPDVNPTSTDDVVQKSLARSGDTNFALACSLFLGALASLFGLAFVRQKLREQD